RPDQRWSAHRRNANRGRIAAAEELDVDRRKARHNAVARHDFHTIKCRPIMSNTDIIAGAGVAIFESKKRNLAGRSSAQPGCCWKMLVVFGKAKRLFDRLHRRLLGCRVMHREFLLLQCALYRRHPRSSSAELVRT